MPAHVSAPACFEGVKKKKVRKGDVMTNNRLDTPKLGFGLMRLPTVEGNPDLIDHEQVCRMVDMFMEAIPRQKTSRNPKRYLTLELDISPNLWY